MLTLMYHVNANLLCIVPIASCMFPAQLPKGPCRGRVHAHARPRAPTEIAPPAHEEDHGPGRGARGRGRPKAEEDHAALADPRQCAVSKLHTGRGPTNSHATLPPPPQTRKKKQQKKSCCPFFVVPYKYGNAGSTSRRFNQLPLLAKAEVSPCLHKQAPCSPRSGQRRPTGPPATQESPLLGTWAVYQPRLPCSHTP